MTQYSPRTIACPIDLEGDRSGVRAAVALAWRTGARLQLVHVVDNPPPAPFEPGLDLDEHWRGVREMALANLEAVCRDETTGRDVDTDKEVLVGVRYKEIAEHATAVDADLLVLASSGREGIAERLLGSVAERVIRLASCPVLTVPAGARDFAPRQILLATDLSPCSDGALPWARFMAETYEADVTLVHVLQRPSRVGVLPDAGTPPTMTEEAWKDVRDATEENLSARANAMQVDGSNVDAELVESQDAGGAILDRADTLRADLVVCGTHGRSGVSRLLLGSTAEKVVRAAECSVLTVAPAFLEGDEAGEAAVAGSTEMAAAAAS